MLVSATTTTARLLRGGTARTAWTTFGSRPAGRAAVVVYPPSAPKNTPGSPLWFSSQPGEKKKKTTSPFATRYSVASDAWTAAAASPNGPRRRKLLDGSSSSGGRPVELVVPMDPPSPERAAGGGGAYTDLGPDVILPTQAGAFRAVPAAALKKALGGAAAHRAAAGGLITFRYNPARHVVHPYSVQYLETTPGPERFPHCFAEVTRRRFAAKDRREPLWWFVLVRPDDRLPKKSPVVRSTARRRVQAAFRQALRRRGYGPEGKPLGGDESDGDGGSGGGKKKALYGTVRMDGRVLQLLSVPHAELVDYLEKVVGVLEGLLHSGPEGEDREQKKGDGRKGKKSSEDKEADAFSLSLNPFLLLDVTDFS